MSDRVLSHLHHLQHYLNDEKIGEEIWKDHVEGDHVKNVMLRLGTSTKAAGMTVWKGDLTGNTLEE